MGLIEKRFIKEGKEEWIPEATTTLRELTGGEQTWDIDWESFATDAEALNNVRNQGIRRILSALRLICADDLGKEATREGFKTIALHNLTVAANKGITLADGVLKVQCAWGKGDAGYFSDNDIRKLVEKLL